MSLIRFPSAAVQIYPKATSKRSEASSPLTRPAVKDKDKIKDKDKDKKEKGEVPNNYQPSHSLHGPLYCVTKHTFAMFWPNNVVILILCEQRSKRWIPPVLPSIPPARCLSLAGRFLHTHTQATYWDQGVSRRLLEDSGKISSNISTIRKWRFWASARLCRQDGKEGSECHSKISKVFFQLKFWNCFGHSFGIVNSFGTVNIFCGRSQSVGTTFLARTSREWFKWHIWRALLYFFGGVLHKYAKIMFARRNMQRKVDKIELWTRKIFHRRNMDKETLK